MEQNNITYHSISEKEMHEWYFDLDFDRIVDGSSDQIISLARRYGLTNENMKRFGNMLKESQSVKNAGVFDATQGFYIAAAQGFLRSYHFCADKSYSELMKTKPYLKEYTKDWGNVLHAEQLDLKTYGQINHKHCAGIYLSVEGVKKLLKDYDANENIQEDISEYFGDYHLVFIAALNSALAGNTGLLEACNIIDNNHEQLSQSTFYTDVQNCDVDGVRIHQSLTRKAKEDNKKSLEKENKQNLSEEAK